MRSSQLQDTNVLARLIIILLEWPWECDLIAKRACWKVRLYGIQNFLASTVPSLAARIRKPIILQVTQWHIKKGMSGGRAENVPWNQGRQPGRPGPALPSRGGSPSRFLPASLHLSRLPSAHRRPCPEGPWPLPPWAAAETKEEADQGARHEPCHWILFRQSLWNRLLRARRNSSMWSHMTERCLPSTRRRKSPLFSAGTR